MRFWCWTVNTERQHQHKIVFKKVNAKFPNLFNLAACSMWYERRLSWAKSFTHTYHTLSCPRHPLLRASLTLAVRLLSSVVVFSKLQPGLLYFRVFLDVIQAYFCLFTIFLGPVILQCPYLLPVTWPYRKRHGMYIYLCIYLFYTAALSPPTSHRLAGKQFRSISFQWCTCRRWSSSRENLYTQWSMRCIQVSAFILFKIMHAKHWKFMFWTSWICYCSSVSEWVCVCRCNPLPI